MRGMAGPAVGAEGMLTRECADQYGQVCDKMISCPALFHVWSLLGCDTAMTI